jgi:predicted NUDIX family NTP pyrophosphohydrolase
MSAKSAGILLFRFKSDKLEVMLVHPGGPFWARKDQAAWSIPKGILDENENPLDAAKREFNEETGLEADGAFIELGEVKQPSGKIVHAWALEKDLDVTEITSNSFTMEWPKNSGKMREYPEIDRAGWFSLDEARTKILKGQVALLDRLVDVVARQLSESG